MRIVVDTNVLISRYCTPHGTTARIHRLWRQQTVDFAVSSKILDEYARVLRYPHLRALHRLTDSELDRIITDLNALSIVVEPSQRLAVVEDDPDDDKFIECAVAANAQFIVSRDKHLLSLGSYKGIQILRPATFLRLVDEGEAPALGSY